MDHDIYGNRIVDAPRAAPKVGLNYPDCTYPRCKEKGSECSGCYAALAPNPRNVLADPEIPVTAEMIAAGLCKVLLHREATREELADAYRAMAAVAPMRCIDEAMELADAELVRRIDALEAENTTLSEELGRAQACVDSERNMRITLEDCLRQAQQTALGYKRQIAAMRIAPTTKPTDAPLTPGDASATAPPERRADGTLKPAAKAWEAPKRASDPRRIGG